MFFNNTGLLRRESVVKCVFFMAIFFWCHKART